MTTFRDLLKKLLSSFKPSLEWNHSNGKSFEEQQADLGAFQYTNEGFTYSRGHFTKTLKWTEITELNVYKKDLITLDEIRMEVVYGDKLFEISEEIPGWHQFVLRTKEVFPSIPKTWEIEIVQPAFATNYKTIYENQDAYKSKT